MNAAAARGAQLDRIRAQMQMGQLDAAIEGLCRLLGEDPNDSDAHAVLALALLDRKRVHAARHEAEIAVSLDPTSALAHLAAGIVHTEQRRLASAEEHLRRARELDPLRPATLRACARLCELRGKRAEVRPLLEESLALDPGDIDTIVALGWHELSHGRLAVAEARARAALSMAPGAFAAIVLMGHVLLHMNRVDDAREHAIWALSLRANDRSALALLTSVKARTSKVLGLWWRWNTWMWQRGGSQQILILVGAYLLYRALTIALAQFSPNVAVLVRTAWLGLCAYTWIAPVRFRKMLERELRTVKLRDGF